MTHVSGVVARAIGSEFSALDGHGVFLNSASVGPLPECAIRVLGEANRDRGVPSRWPVERLNQVLASSRELAARLIGAEPDEIALMMNTTMGLNVAMQALPLQSGDVVLTFDGEFPSNVYPVLARAREGIVLERIPRTPEGWPDEQALLERIAHPDVKAAIVSLTQFSNGYTIDLAALSDATRAAGKWLIIDAIQAAGQLPIDVTATPVDFLACGAQKWLLSPWGTGFLYVRRELCQQFAPTFAGWAAFRGTDDYTRLTEYDPRPWPDARRFEIITLPVQDLAAMNESVSLLLAIGIDNVARHALELQEPLIERAVARGTAITSPRGPRGSAIVCLRPPDAAEAYQRLQRAGVHCSLREGSIRLSPHVFNSAHEIDRVADLLRL